MKHPISALLLALSFACGEKKSTDPVNILENFTYSIDTLSVKSNDEVINLGFGLTSFSLSPDKKSLYYFDTNRSLLQEIDLEELELINNYQFERDGPNSIGFNPPQFRSLPGDRILFTTHGFGVNVFGVNGEKQKSLKFNFREIEGLDYDEEGLITYKATLSDNEKLLFTLSKFDPTLPDFKLIVINPDEKTGKTISLPAMNQTLKSKIISSSQNSFMWVSGHINLQSINGKLYAVSSITSDIYEYDYKWDSLLLHEFQHKLVPSKKTGEFKNQVSDEKEFYEEMGKLIYQITFEKLLWDDQLKLFFRFAHKPIPDQERKWYNEAEIFLFAYDLHLNLLGEIYLPKLKKVPDYSFFKDGKLWSCVNVEDELGFAVMDIKF